ncbi:MAG: hypothetical protein AAFO04_09170 [Cyanobacteria bacterium J06592_8]
MIADSGCGKSTLLNIIK